MSRTAEAPREPFNLLLSKKERARYQGAADADKRSLSDWIRLACDAASLPPTKNKKES
jgi:hypothetical protein